MIDFRNYLKYSESFLIKSEAEEHDKYIYLIPSITLSWSAIESFVNNILDDFGSLPDDLFDLHEKALLEEKSIYFNDSGEKIGEFELRGSKYRRLEEKIFFLLAKFSYPKKSTIKSDPLWKDFKDFKTLRDNLIHPRKSKQILLDKEKAEKYLNTAKNIIKLIGKNVWNKEIKF